MRLNLACGTALALALVITACSVGAADGPKALIGKEAPNFKLDLLAGGEVELSKLEGKNVVLLDFWATWCPPCREVMPALLEVSNEYKPKGVRYLAVNLREDKDKISAYLKSAKLDIEVPLDKDGKIAELYRVEGIPTMAIVDKKGIVREVHVGATPNVKADLKKALDKILAE
jgi:thiol-disulfide isomerase/thioredoxin